MNDLLWTMIGDDGNGAGWVILTVILTSGVVSALVTKLLERGAKRDERVRDGYADSTAVLVAWGEFPYRVARRTSDEAEVCAALVGRGHDAQEGLACRHAWIVGESVVMSEFYSAITVQLRPQVADATQAAWRRAPASGGAGMVLSDGQPMPQVEVQRFVDLWCLALRYRFGWRRWVFMPGLLRRAISNCGVPLAGPLCPTIRKGTSPRPGSR
ncbi:hypothetical protein [Humibacillus sp. DSM 29435]|uniref:hypothetical protein n=1 Tax=Humibacillus sp. DSM 29435 TaxID=1869167 RepID=UPI0011131B55|nr:hypothetical protein [Humibacillus sp. DSM 29435]